MKGWLLLTLMFISFLTGGYLYLYRPVEIKRAPPVILGHGGMGVRHYHPINSIASVEAAMSYPINGTELDIRISANGVLIAFHDQNLDHSSECAGRIIEKPSEEIKACRYKSWFGCRSEPIATLHSVLDAGWKSGSVFSLDLKPDIPAQSNLRDALVQAIKETTDRYDRYQFLIESRDIGLLNQLSEQKVSAKLFLYAQNTDSDVELALRNNLDGVSLNMSSITVELTQVKKTGLKVMLWGTGSVIQNRKAILLQPDFIQTDDIPSITKILRH